MPAKIGHDHHAYYPHRLESPSDPPQYSLRSDLTYSITDSVRLPKNKTQTTCLGHLWGDFPFMTDLRTDEEQIEQDSLRPSKQRHHQCKRSGNLSHATAELASVDVSAASYLLHGDPLCRFRFFGRVFSFLPGVWQVGTRVAAVDTSRRSRKGLMSSGACSLLVRVWITGRDFISLGGGTIRDSYWLALLTGNGVMGCQDE
nr:hypothetical protein CFP56_07932 [Quercus suber]POF05259.1 hypothetical protein CFP56_76084 [Quercus suber]